MAARFRRDDDGAGTTGARSAASVTHALHTRTHNDDRVDLPPRHDHDRAGRTG